MKKQASRVRIGLIRVIALGLAGAAGGCSEINNPVRPSLRSSDGGAAVTSVTSASESPADVTFPVGPELAAVRRATAEFHDISTAYAAGYTTQFEPCVENPGVGVMGVHARNESLMGDQLLDPLRPELLLYAPKPNGAYRLVGVEYFQVVLLRNPATNEVAPWVSPDPWPSNYEVVTPTPQLFGRTFDGPMPGHIPTMPWHWDLHVWVWAQNPSGMFAEWNPSLQCG
jgi:hypothetical protein